MKKVDVYFFRYKINKKMAEDEWIKYYNNNDPIHICYKKRYESNSYYFLLLWYKEVEKDQPKIEVDKTNNNIPVQLKIEFYY